MNRGPFSHSTLLGLAAPFALVALCAPGLASAEVEEDAGRSTAIQLSIADYMPSIDDQFTSRPGPYEKIFENQSSLMFEVTWEGHIIRDYGALTGGLSIGYWSVEGTTRLENDSVGEDSTSFQMLPLSAQISYRFDMFAESFPLAPIVRVGLDYYLWRILDGEDEVAEFSPGNEAAGATYGWHGAVGVHLLLDFFAPDMALNFQRDAGVYNSFLVAEYRFSQIDEFGSASSFRLGDETFVFGLALEL